MKRLWRWLTYKRVLIVYNADFVSESQLARAMDIMQKEQRIDALAFRVYGVDNMAIQVWGIDYLTQLEYEAVRRIVASYSDSPVPIVDPETIKREAVAEFSQHVEKGHELIQKQLEKELTFRYPASPDDKGEFAVPDLHNYGEKSVIDPKELL